jgi:acetylornithine deacetylase/succinyl-diaminopimelate desuccinylase-like protein
MATDFVLTENGGLHGGSRQAPSVSVSVGEKGAAWRRLTVRGTPGHGSMPFKADSALVKAAAVISALAEYAPPARVHDLWPGQLDALGVDEQTKARLLDPAAIDEFLAELPRERGAPFIHACTHTTVSPNVGVSPTKTNVIPDRVSIDVDIRTLPGEGTAEVDEHLRAALGDHYDDVDVEVLIDDPSSISPVDNPLWDALQKAVSGPFPEARLQPLMAVGFTDARVHRELGSIAYGAGLLSPTLAPAEFASRFHGNDERIDVESLGLTSRFIDDVVRDVLG